MRTNIDIDSQLPQSAMELAQARTKKEVVHIALTLHGTNINSSFTNSSTSYYYILSGYCY